MKLRAMFVVALAAAAVPADAAQIVTTYKGTANIQYDDYNYFQGLTGSHDFEVIYTLDDSLGKVGANGVNLSNITGGTLSGFSNPISAVIKTGGVVISLGDVMTHGASATRFNDYDIEGFGVPEDFIADVIDQIIMTDPSTGILEQLTVRNSLRSSVNQFYATADYMSPFSYVAQPGDVSDASVSGFARHLVDTNTGKFISRTYVQFRTTSVSSEVLQSAVPEPATWATMLLGFGLIGGGMRYRRRQRVRVTYA